MLRRGGLVAFPTETVYGLGADATRAEAVARIYAAKERPRFNPLIAHVASLDAARREGVFDESALALAARFWPGPLTLVVPGASGASVCDLARAGLDSVALRVPAHPLAHALLERVGPPAAAPPADPAGRGRPPAAPSRRRRRPARAGSAPRPPRMSLRTLRAASTRCWTAARPRSGSNRRSSP